jgi:hypothetical protein
MVIGIVAAIIISKAAIILRALAAVAALTWIAYRGRQQRQEVIQGQLQNQQCGAATSKLLA